MGKKRETNEFLLFLERGLSVSEEPPEPSSDHCVFHWDNCTTFQSGSLKSRAVSGHFQGTFRAVSVPTIWHQRKTHFLDRHLLTVQFQSSFSAVSAPKYQLKNQNQIDHLTKKYTSK